MSTQSIKSLELREQRSVGSKVRFEEDASSKRSTVKLDFDSLGLVGRQKQVSALRICFDSMHGDNPSMSQQDGFRLKEFVILSGESGSGKTSTVKTLESYMLKTNVGVFVEGKFEMNKTDEPYSGIAKAMAAICQKIIDGDKSHADHIREKISNALHDDEFQLLVGLMPGLVEIVPADVKGEFVSREVDVDELENGIERLKQAFRLLIRIFCEHLAPMVLFLDDLQWADVSSLQMIDYLMSDTENESPLMIIGAFRSDEVDENSLLHNKILALREKSVTCNFNVTEVDIPAFDIDDVMTTIKAIFVFVHDDDSKALAELCLKRTLGNPYFVLEFLKMLYREGLVEYSTFTKMWKWNLADVEDATMSTANVVVLLHDRMKRLSKYAQMFLSCAAYLGSTFRNVSLELVWKSHGMPVTIGEKPILPLLMIMAVKDNFIEECGAEKYRWVHDKVQEAAFSLLKGAKMSQFDIGRMLYYSLEPSQLDQDIFAVVDLINTGNTEKRAEFARANLQAARKAFGLAAFQSASRYCFHGIDLLKDTDWSTDRELKLNLYSVGADSELVVGNVDTAERYIEEVLERGDFTTMETLPLAMTKVKAMSSALRLDDAVDFCLLTLRDLDHKVTAHRRLVPFETFYAVMKTVKKLKKVPKDFHKHIGVITNPKQKGIVAITASLNYVAYTAGDSMLAILAECKIVDMTLKYGLNEYSGESVATMGAAILLMQQDYKTVQRFMELALAIQHTIGKAKFCKTVFVAHYYGLAWTMPISKCLPTFGNGYVVGMQMGETVFGTWDLFFHRVVFPLYLGHALDQIQNDCSKVLAHAEEVAQQDQALCARCFSQTIINFCDPLISHRTRLEGDALDPKVHKCESSSSHITFCLLEAMLLLIFSDYEAAADRAIEKGDYYSKSAPGGASVMYETFHRAISLFARARQTQNNKLKKAAKKLQKRIAGWQKAGNPNVKHFVLVLDAESAALSNDIQRTMAKYQEAIAVASKDGYLQYVALFNERYADYLSQHPSLADEAANRKCEAIQAYQAWGAHAKVAQMMGKS
ncbi:MAG: hypothetical protein SGBAC_012418 [Bacillariaceae sp.]